MLENGQVLAARFVLLRRLGASRWGEVWLAREGDGGREVALKILDPALADQSAPRARFLDAARLQMRLKDPQVLPCEEVVDAEPLFAVFPHVAGGDLSGWRGRSWTELAPALERIACGVAAIHAQGYVHRDLKPANVLQDEQGPVLSDLGVAARVGETDALPPGSPFNASPQQRKGEPPSVSDDVYGFGALCYELLSGYPPYYPDAAAAAGDAAPAPIRARV